MAAKIGHGVKIKLKFFDREGNEVKPIQKEGKMFWYSEVSGYHKDWFSKQVIKIGGRE